MEDTIYKHNPVEAALTFSALLLNPDYNSTTGIIEKAIHLCLSGGKGTLKVTNTFIRKVFDHLYSSGYRQLEDPTEDVLAAKLWFFGQDYRVLTGLWEGGIPETQYFLNVLEIFSEKVDFDQLTKEVRSILEASNDVVSRSGIPINEVTCDTPKSRLKSSDILSVNSILDLLTVSTFKSLPVLEKVDWQDLSSAVMGKSKLEANPFICHNEGTFLALPTAITTCIRRKIFNFFKKKELLNSLSDSLAHQVSKSLGETRLLGEYQGIPIEFRKKNETDDWLFANASIEFDRGYHFHFIFLMDSLKDFDKDWFSGGLVMKDDISVLLAKEFDDFASKIRVKNSDANSISVLVPCGFGRGLGIGLNPNEKYLFESINVNDLITLSNHPDCNPFRFWRLVEAQHESRGLGAKILNPNGFLNLFGYTKQNDFSLIEHSQFSDTTSENVMVIVGTNFQKDIREKVLRNVSKQRVVHPIDGDLIVQKGYAESHFSKNDAENIYCPLGMKLSKFQAVLILPETQIWIELETSKNMQMELQVKIFEALVHWIPRTVNCLFSKHISCPKISLIEIHIDYPDDVQKVRLDVKEEDVESSVTYVLDDDILECYFNCDLISGFALPGNCSERTLLSPFIHKMCRDNRLLSTTVLNEVFKSPYARHVHLFQSESYVQHIISNPEQQEPITLEVASENNLKFKLGWLTDSRPEKTVFAGKSECITFLNQIVSKLINRAKSKLARLNKQALVFELLENIEFCNIHQMRWRRTFRANLDMREDTNDLYSVASKEIGEVTSATLASRLIIEMAICEGGDDKKKIPGKMDIQELQSYLLNLYQLGGLSDSIRYDAIEPKIVLSFFGDVMFEHNFQDQIVENYQFGLQSTQFKNIAANIEKSYSNKNEAPSRKEVQDSFDSNFWEAFIEEFGFNPNDGIDFTNAVQELGIKKSKLVLKVSESELKSLNPNLEPSHVEKIISCMTLVDRDDWEQIPSPFKKSDWQPWRFKRRYSLAFKPLIYLKSTQEFIVSPAQLQRGYLHLLRSCYEAQLDKSNFTSKKMIQWDGATKEKNGLQFNVDVAKLFKAAFWCTELEVKLTKILNKKLIDYGDVDVLAWHKSKNIVLAIECKNLEMAKTNSEIAKQLYEFRGEKNEKGKNDRLKKHMIRIEVLENNIQGLKKYVGMQHHEDIKLIGIVVFSDLVPMNYLNKSFNRILMTNVHKLIDEVDVFLNEV